METKSDEDICLFFRDERTRRILFNPQALQVLGINPVEAWQRGYPMQEQPAMVEVEEDLTARTLRRQLV